MALDRIGLPTMSKEPVERQQFGTRTSKWNLVQWLSKPVGLRDWILDLLEWERICWDRQRSEGNNNTKSKTQPLTHKPNKRHNLILYPKQIGKECTHYFFPLFYHRSSSRALITGVMCDKCNNTWKEIKKLACELTFHEVKEIMEAHSWTIISIRSRPPDL